MVLDSMAVQSFLVHTCCIYVSLEFTSTCGQLSRICDRIVVVPEPHDTFLIFAGRGISGLLNLGDIMFC